MKIDVAEEEQLDDLKSKVARLERILCLVATAIDHGGRIALPDAIELRRWLDLQRNL